MINIINKIDCCGCNACGDICPHNAISFKTDIEGFWYPEVNFEFCTDCGLCENVCPVIKPADKIIRYKEPIVYAAYAKDDAIRMDSTSGGIHSILSNTLYKENAFVGGAIYNDDHTVSQIIDDNPERLSEIRSSKYLQSNALGVYREIRTRLREGRKVFFCGCPCQIQALYKFLGNKEYNNLITCDFICRGVNSPKVFLKYIDMLERQYGSKATAIKFKNKKWGWHNFSMRVTFENGKEYCKDRYHDLFFIGYLQAGNFTRPSCYHCHFKGFPQKSDITLADFWGIEKIDPSMDQDKGTSLVMLNSDKGVNLFESIKEEIEWRQFTLEDASRCNPAMNTPLQASNSNRYEFFEALDKIPFDKVAKKFFVNNSFFSNLKIMIKKYVRLCYEGWKFIRFQGFSFSAWINFMKYNFFTRRIKTKLFSPLCFSNNVYININKGAKMFVDARVLLGEKQVNGSKLETRILLEENASLSVKGNFRVFAGSYIRVIKGGHLILNGGFINENVQITCSSNIEIGEDATIGRDVVIRSYDGHTILQPDYKVSEPIKIGKHVWIGQGATILKGVTIGDGAIVASGAIVTRDIPANCIAAGVPAKIIKENISWE